MADAAAAAAAAAKPVYMFYHVQGERGESAAHPNACRLALATPGRVTLADVLASFPLAGTASFHFRFQMAVDKQLVFIDLVGPEDSVPLMNGSVIAKVLRLGASATACVWRRRACARRPAARAVSAAARARPAPPECCVPRPPTRACRHGQVREPAHGAPAAAPQAAVGLGDSAGPRAARR